MGAGAGIAEEQTPPNEDRQDEYVLRYCPLCRLRGKLLRLNEEIIQQEEQAENIGWFIGKVRKYLELEKLTPTVFNDMVKAVYVHAPDKSKGHRKQQVDIAYDLVEILLAAMLNDLQNGETA